MLSRKIILTGCRVHGPVLLFLWGRLANQVGRALPLAETALAVVVVRATFLVRVRRPPGRVGHLAPPAASSRGDRHDGGRISRAGAAGRAAGAASVA